MEMEGKWGFWMVRPSGAKQRTCVISSCGRFECPATLGAVAFYGDTAKGGVKPEFHFSTKKAPGTAVNVVVGKETFVFRQKYKEPQYFADPLSDAEGERLLAAIILLAKGQPKASFEVIDSREKRYPIPVAGLLKSLQKMQPRCGIKVP